MIPKSSTSTTRPELSEVRITTKLLIAETLRCTSTELTAHGTNSSDIKSKVNSSIRKAKFLTFKRAKIEKVPTPLLIIWPVRELIHNSGRLDISIPRTRLLLVEMEEKDSKSIDLSTSNPECG